MLPKGLPLNHQSILHFLYKLVDFKSQPLSYLCQSHTKCSTAWCIWCIFRQIWKVLLYLSKTVIVESQQLVTDESVEFEKYPVEVQDCKRITDHFRGIYRIYLNLMKENWRMSTCSWLDLQTLGSQLIMPKNLLDHWKRDCQVGGLGE